MNIVDALYREKGELVTQIEISQARLNQVTQELLQHLRAQQQAAQEPSQGPVPDAATSAPGDGDV